METAIVEQGDLDRLVHGQAAVYESGDPLIDRGIGIRLIYACGRGALRQELSRRFIIGSWINAQTPSEEHDGDRAGPRYSGFPAHAHPDRIEITDAPVQDSWKGAIFSE